MKLEKIKAVKLKDGSVIDLRSPSIEDAEAYISFAKEIFETSDFVITQADEYEGSIENQIKYIEDLNTKKNNIAIIADFKGKIVGNIDLRCNHKRRRISHRGEFGMSVIPSFKRKGLGEQLIKALIEWAKEDNNTIEKIELKVAEKNTPALNLYKKMGFKEEGKIFRELKISDNKYLDTIMMGLCVKE